MSWIQILISIPFFCICIYIVSRLQMKGWLHEIEKFLHQKLNEYQPITKKDEDKKDEF